MSRWWWRPAWARTGRRRISTTFRDHFSQASGGYAKSRPTYPDTLFARLAELAPARASAWDCATGSGQAALGLARHFAQVEATDASAQQVSHAAAAPNIRYSVQPAEATDFAPASFDAVCVAQALHWFDFDRFNAEVKRVLRPRGLLLVAGYTWAHVSPDFDRVLQRAVLDPIAPYWPPQNQFLVDGYRDVPFPFERIAFPRMAIEVTWTLAQYLDYMATWTATRRMLEVDTEFLVRAAALLRGPWGGAEARGVTMPLVVLCGRHGG